MLNIFQKQLLGQRCSVKKMFLEILQTLREKRDSGTSVFILYRTPFYRTPPVAASNFLTLLLQFLHSFCLPLSFINQMQFLYNMFCTSVLFCRFHFYFYLFNNTFWPKYKYSHSRYCIYNTTLHFFIKKFSFKVCYRISGPQISHWSVIGQSAVSTFGWWSVDRCLVVGGRLVGGRWQVVGWSVVLRKHYFVI